MLYEVITGTRHRQCRDLTAQCFLGTIHFLIDLGARHFLLTLAFRARIV